MDQKVSANHPGTAWKVGRGEAGVEGIYLTTVFTTVSLMRPPASALRDCSAPLVWPLYVKLLCKMKNGFRHVHRIGSVIFYTSSCHIFPVSDMPMLFYKNIP